MPEMSAQFAKQFHVEGTERVAEAPEAIEGGCCDPLCGPDACSGEVNASAQAIVRLSASGPEKEQAESLAGCCDPFCGPETCECG